MPTVRDCIEALSALPPDLEVMIRDGGQLKVLGTPVPSMIIDLGNTWPSLREKSTSDAEIQNLNKQILIIQAEDPY